MTTQEKNGITEGVIWKQLLIFFFPILVGSFFQQLYNTVDSVIVGQFVGKEALSSVGGSAGQIISLVVGFFTGVSTGATVIISQYFGAGKKEEIEESLHTAYAFALVGGLVLGIAQKSIAIVRSWTSTFIGRFSFSRKIGTSMIRCRLRYPPGFGFLI